MQEQELQELEKRSVQPERKKRFSLRLVLLTILMVIVEAFAGDAAVMALEGDPRDQMEE